MPGQTNNQTLLSAENQEIVALNEIRAALEDLATPTVTVDLSGLETVIAALGVTLSNALENLNMNITQNNNCGCCGGSGSGTTTPPTSPPVDPGSGGPGGGGPGDPPGDGQEEPPGTAQEKALRRCKMAVWLVDKYLIGVTKELDLRGVDTYINRAIQIGAGPAAVLTVGLLSGVIAAAIGLFLTPGPTPDDIFTSWLGFALGGVITFLIINGGTVDFASLVGFLENNRVELICALNSAQYAAGARAAFLRVVDNTSPNLDTGNRNFLGHMVALPILVLLYYTDRKYQVLEGWLAEQPDDCPCTDVDPSTETPTDDYKCKAANYIFDSFTDTLVNFSGVSGMSWYSVASFIAALGNGLLSNFFTGIFSLLITALTTVIPALISYLGRLYWKGTGYFTPFDLIAAEFEANKEAIICELYEAADVATARAALASHIADYVGNVMTAHPEWVDEQQTYIDAVTSLLPNAVLNELFVSGANERPEINGYAPVDFYDCACGVASACNWEFETDVEGWTFAQILGNGGGIGGFWSNELGPDGGLMIDVVTTNQAAEQSYRWRSPSLNCQGDFLSFRIWGNYNNAGQWRSVVHYDDNTSTEQTHTTAVNDARVMSINPAKTVMMIDIIFEHTIPATNFSYTQGIFGVGIGQSPP